jgi:hypothetical protein
MKRNQADDLAWRKDPNMLQTAKVQVWRGGILLTADWPLEKARQYVAEGRAMAICDQAIWLLDKKEDAEANRG